MIQINENFHAARQEIMDKYTNLNQEKDARITIFANCIVALNEFYSNIFSLPFFLHTYFSLFLVINLSLECIPL
jgi:hypothetical protein